MFRRNASRRDERESTSDNAVPATGDVPSERTAPAYAAAPGRMWVPRSRGAVSGIALILLGFWGALIPFVGPYFSFSFDPDEAWIWTSARGWLEVLPGAVTVVGGVLLLLIANRAVASLGAWLGVFGGAWFIAGPILAPVLNIENPGNPTASRPAIAALQQLAFFEGLGAVILFFGAAALGRLSLRSHRDIRRARRPVETDTPPLRGSTTSS
ncbi:hypothetical protein [Rhodococcus sp. 24CO]|uniref:hypothetical protein n=1 Tax=Rhodococcus sp. 24CO TaxID=3117460 RepID=UPI003D35245C